MRQLNKRLKPIKLLFRHFSSKSRRKKAHTQLFLLLLFCFVIPITIDKGKLTTSTVCGPCNMHKHSNELYISKWNKPNPIRLHGDCPEITGGADRGKKTTVKLFNPILIFMLSCALEHDTRNMCQLLLSARQARSHIITFLIAYGLIIVDCLLIISIYTENDLISIYSCFINFISS